MTSASIVNVTELIDARPIGRVQVGIVALCGLIALLDGYDLQVIGLAAPSIARSLQIAPQQLGTIFSAALAGLTLGAFFLGPVADRFGRKRVLICSTLCFGVFTLCTPLATSFTSLLAFRFLTGLGLGGAMPSFIALTSEYTPPRLRTTVVGILYAFFPLGGAIGGVLGSWLIPHWGWQWLFWIGGTLPLVLAVALAAFLPESIGYLVSRGGAPERVAALLRRVCGAVVAPGSLFVLGEERASGTPVAQLFGRGRALGTMLLWVSFFIAFMQLVTTTAWTPTLLSHAGVPLSQAALALAIFNIGSVIGSCSVGFLIARFGAALVLPVGFVGTAVSLSLVGYAAPSVALIWLMAGLLGLFLGCGSTGLIAVCAIFYPTAVRSTGVGWAMGMGRFGSFVGPLVIGGLVGAAWTVGPVFVAIGAPAVIAAVTAGLARSGRSAA